MPVSRPRSALPSDPIRRLEGYVANLSAVPAARRTAAQQAALQTYTARLLDYRSRAAGAAPAPTPGGQPGGPGQGGVILPPGLVPQVAPPAAGLQYALPAGAAVGPGAFGGYQGLDMTALAPGYGQGVAIPYTGGPMPFTASGQTGGGPMVFTPSSTAGPGPQPAPGRGGGLGLTDIAIIGGALVALMVAIRSKGNRS